jgi:DNA primase catalytic core
MKNSEQAIQLLNAKLKEYLLLKNIKIDSKDFFSCVSPEHEDLHPSMSLFKDEHSDTILAHCFSCQITVNIFHAAHYIENLPISGREFFNITIPTLCKYFGIEYIPDELTEDEREAYTRKRAYRDASNIICSIPQTDNNAIVQRILDRGFTRKTAEQYSIGGIESFDVYKKAMINLGWEEQYLLKVDLLNPSIFNANNLLFTIKNEHGEPVAFVARRVPWDKTMKTSKFENSPNSDIYKKGHILYNLDRARRIKSGPLWIVEGYPDTITLSQLGIHKVAGIGGIAFTEDHAELLNRISIYELVICLDGDNEGIKATEKTLEELSKYKCFNLKVVEIPYNMDPDDYLKKYTVNDFKSLPKLTPFEWMLKHSNSTGEELVNKTIPIILEEKNFVTQREMCNSLSKLSGVELYIIRKEIERRQNWEENEFQDKVKNIKERLAFRLQKEHTNVRVIIDDTLRDLKRLEKAHKSSLEEEDEYKCRYESLKTRYLSNPALIGYKIPSFPQLEKALDGIPKTQSLIAVAGKSNVGKTSWLRYLSYDLVKNNPDLLILFMTIDDNFEKTITPFVAIDQGFTIEQVRKPTILLNETEMDKFNLGWKNILAFQENKLVIRDVTSGNDLDTLERHINKYYEKYPDKKVVVILDNFHKLGGKSKGVRREDIVDKSERIKEISNIYNLPIIMTVELKKLYAQRRPTLEDISESAQIEYDCDIALLLHNELHNDKLTPLKWEYNKMMMPFLEVDIAKNKETSAKQMIPYKFTTTKSSFKEVDDDEFDQLRKKMADYEHIIKSTRDFDVSNKR